MGYKEYEEYQEYIRDSLNSGCLGSHVFPRDAVSGVAYSAAARSGLTASARDAPASVFYASHRHHLGAADLLYFRNLPACASGAPVSV
jgi:hypothetical protein